jgi:MFS family permease
MYIRKFLGFVITSLLSGLILSYLIILEEGYEVFETLIIILTFSTPVILLIGVPVSMLSDYLTKNLNGKKRYTNAIFIHIIFGLIIGLVISILFESVFYLISSLIASFIFWLVDEILRKKI